MVIVPLTFILTDTVPQTAKQHCLETPKEVVDLSSWKVSDATLSLLALCNADVLRELRIDKALLTLRGISALEKCSNLHSLSLIACGLKDGCLNSLCRVLHAQLTELDLSHNVELGNATVERIVHFCLKLRMLKLSGCSSLTNASLLSIAKPRGSPSVPDGTTATLSHLDLSFCRGISDEGVSCLLENCHGLEFLSLSGCQSLTDLAFVGLAERGWSEEGEAYDGNSGVDGNLNKCGSGASRAGNVKGLLFLAGYKRTMHPNSQNPKTHK